MGEARGVTILHCGTRDTACLYTEYTVPDRVILVRV